MSKKLPKKLFIKWNTEGDEPFLEPSEKHGCLAEQDEVIEAGVYELKEKVKLVNATEVIKSKKDTLGME